MIRFVFGDGKGGGQGTYKRKMLLETSQEWGKNPEMGTYLMCFRNSKEATVVGVQSRQEE